MRDLVARGSCARREVPVSRVESRDLLGDRGDGEGGIASGDGHREVPIGASDAPRRQRCGEDVDDVGEVVETITIEDVVTPCAVGGRMFDGEMSAAVGEFFGFGDDEFGGELVATCLRGAAFAGGVLVEGVEFGETPGVRVVVEDGHGDAFRCRVPRTGDGDHTWLAGRRWRDV